MRRLSNISMHLWGIIVSKWLDILFEKGDKNFVPQNVFKTVGSLKV